MRFNLIANAASSVREICKTQLSQLRSGAIADLDGYVSARHILECPCQHRLEDLAADGVPDEVEDDDVFAHPVQKLRSVDHLLEMPVDLAPHVLLDAGIVFGRGHVQNPVAVLVEPVDAKI